MTSPVTHFRESDGVFTVRAWTELSRRGHPRHRVRYWYKGGERVTDNANTPEEAVAKAAGIWRAHLDGFLDAPEQEPLTIGELADRFGERDELADATRVTYTRTVGLFVNFVDAGRPLNHIGKSAVQRWLAAMTCGDVSRASYLRTLRAMFRWAMAQDWLRDDPTRGITIKVKSHVIRPWLQHHEWAAFLEACSPAHRIRAEFVLHTGLRAGELVNAEWTWLHGVVGRRAISVPKSKSARARAIPLDRRGALALDSARERWGDTGYIFADRLIRRDNFQRATAGACKKAGVTVTDFHGLRRSAGARWLQCGASLLEVSRLLGHADISTTAKHYAGIADTSLARVMDRVDAMEDDENASSHSTLGVSLRG